MKNKEKYAEILINEFLIKGQNIAVDSRTKEPKTCRGMNCTECLFVSLTCDGAEVENARKEWLEAEYEEPPIDWRKVAVDTPILVSNENKHWKRRYFAEYKDGFVYAWNNGMTSWTATKDATLHWQYAKLADENEAE